MFNSIMLSGNAPQGATTGGAYSNLTLSQVVVSGGLLLGDVDLNGTVDFFDIAPFIDLLALQTFQFEADIDGNGTVDFFDIQPFIEILAGG